MPKIKSTKVSTTIKANPAITRLGFVSSKNRKKIAIKRSTIIFSDSAKKPESQMTPIEKMERLQVGIGKKELETLKIRTALDYDKLAKLLLVTRATLINKPSSEKFSSALSERILGLADLYSFGYEVFEDEANFNEWMFRPNYALGGKTPFELCNNQFGREEVKNIIGRIEHGVYS